MMLSRIRFAACLLAGVAPAVSRAQNNQNKIKERVPEEVLALVITPEGFLPGSMSITQGVVFFAVYNRTALPDITLQLDRTNQGNGQPQKVKDAPLPRGKRAWREVMDLSPGNYILTVRESPSWRFALTVRPK